MINFSKFHATSGSAVVSIPYPFKSLTISSRLIVTGWSSINFAYNGCLSSPTTEAFLNNGKVTWNRHYWG
jgi:hypothetical protein